MSVGINRVHTGGGPLRDGAGEAPGSGRQGTVPIPLRPHHLVAQDADLSRRLRRFESDWGYDSRSRSERRTWACLPGGIGRRGALKRRCPSGREGSSPSGGTGLQWCAENGKQASSGERSPAVIHGACWGTVTEKPLAGSNPVTAEGSRACGAVGSAPPWHGGGQGFDPPQVHSKHWTWHCNYASVGEMRVPTLASVSELDSSTAQAIDLGWREVSKASAYLKGRDVLADRAGGPEALLADPALQELQDAVRNLRLGDCAYGVESSVRWAYLASLTPQVLSVEQYDALTRGWRAGGN